MRKTILLLFLSVQGMAMAQFHTLKTERNIFVIETEQDQEATPVTEKGEPARLQTPRQSFSLDSLRDVYMDRYYSVSLPLQTLGISSRFGLRRDPFDHSRISRHNGLDLKAPTGTCVYAMFAGRVIKVHSDPVSGNYVSLQHGDYVVSFCHLSQQLVSLGDCVKPGDVVGLSGNTGRSTGSHLHITCRRKGEYVNPVILLEYIIEVRTHALEELNRLLG